MSWNSVVRVLVVSTLALAARGAPAGDDFLAGVVRWPDGRPAANAKVFATQDASGIGLDLEFDLGVRRDTTDAKGAFRIGRIDEGVWALKAEILEPGDSKPGVVRLPLRARVGGLAPGTRDVVLNLQGGSVLRGRAIDDRGEPVTAVKVDLRHVTRFEGDEPRSWSTEKFSIDAPGGRFEIHGLQPGAWLVAVGGPAHVSSADLRLDLPAEVPARDFVTPRAARIEGIVVDAQGIPVAGALVTVRARGERVPHADDLFDTFLDELVVDPEETKPKATPGTTDARGRFELGGLRPGRCILRADAPGHARSVPRDLDLAPASTTTDLRIALRRGATLRGFVRAPTGDPVGGVDVGIIVDGGSTWQTTKSNGFYRFEHVMPGKILLAARQESVPGAVTQLSPEVIELDVTLHEGDDVEVPIGGPPPKPTTRVTGVVRGALSVANAKVRFDPEREGAEYVETRTNANGEYELALAERGPYWVILHLPSDSLAERSVVIGDDEVQVVDFELPGTLLRGRVVDPSGEPVRARIRVRRTDLESSNGGWSTIGSDNTAKDGSFVFEGLERGPWRVSVTPRDGASKLARRHVVVDLLREPKVEGFSVTLAPGGAIEGLVRGLDGAPAAGARVTARGEDGFDHDHESPAEERAATDAAGRFRIEGLTPGTWRVRAVAEGLASRESEPLQVTSSAAVRAELTLALAGFVDVRLENDLGEPLRHGPAEATRVYDAAGKPWSDLEEEQYGELVRRFGPLPAGKWIVRRGDGVQFPAIEIEIRPGEGQSVTLRAHP